MKQETNQANHKDLHFVATFLQKWYVDGHNGASSRTDLQLHIEKSKNLKPPRAELEAIAGPYKAQVAQISMQKIAQAKEELKAATGISIQMIKALEDTIA